MTARQVTFYLVSRNFSILLLPCFSFSIICPLTAVTIHLCKSRPLNCDCFACVEHPGDNRPIAIALPIVCLVSAFRAIFHLSSRDFQPREQERVTTEREKERKRERERERDKLTECLYNCTVEMVIRTAGDRLYGKRYSRHQFQLITDKRL